jgi:uncharacterized protein (TIGR02996 family)
LPIEPYFRALPGCEPFLQAIAEEPDDDIHRLVFADWLEDQGQPERAQFIRLQVEMARNPAQRMQHYSRVYEMERTHRDTWAQGLLHLKGLVFKRGMLEVLPLSRFVGLKEKDRELIDVRVCVIDTTAIRRLTTLLASEQVRYLVGLIGDRRLDPALLEVLDRCGNLTSLRHLNLARAINADGVRALAGLPLLAQLHSLDLGYSRCGNVLLDLVGSRYFPRLRRLELELCHLIDAAAQSIAGSEKLEDLTYLDLSRNYILTTGGNALAASVHLKNLTHLDLTGNKLGVTARQALADATAFPRLRYLAMDGHVIQNEAGVGLARVQAWARDASSARPTSLDLTDAGMTAEAFRELLATPAFESVTSLILRHGLVRPEALVELVESPAFAHITSLDLGRNRLKESHLKCLLQSPHVSGLATLNVEGNDLSLAAADSLVHGLPGLKSLRLSGNQPLARLVEHSSRLAALTGTTTPGTVTIGYSDGYPGDEFASKLVATHYLADLHTLNLDCCRMTAAGLATLAASPYLTGLTTLRLSSTWNVALEGFEALIDSPHLGNLTALTITHIHAPEALARLRARWPFAHVTEQYE